MYFNIFNHQNFKSYFILLNLNVKKKKKKKKKKKFFFNTYNI